MGTERVALRARRFKPRESKDSPVSVHAADPGGTPGEDEFPPPCLRKVAVRQREGGCLCRTGGGVVEAAEECLQMGTPIALPGNAEDELLRQLRAGDVSEIDLVIDFRGLPVHLVQGNLRQQFAFDGVPQGVAEYRHFPVHGVRSSGFAVELERQRVQGGAYDRRGFQVRHLEGLSGHPVEGGPDVVRAPAPPRLGSGRPPAPPRHAQ